MTEMMVATVSKMVSRLRAAMMPSTRPTSAPSVTAIQSNDYNVVIGLSFIYSAMYIGIMLVVDLLYGIIDPRIRLAKGDD